MRYLSPTVVLILTLSATGCSPATVTPTTSAAPLVTISLEKDGLGDVLFGFDPDTAISDISALFGGPDYDSDWIPTESNIFGTCPGEMMRAVGWGSLVTIFVDEGSNLGGWFYTYTYGYDYVENEGGVDPRGLDLTTGDGIGLGSTVADLMAAYGSDVTITGDTSLEVWSFRAVLAGFRGLLSGSEAQDRVTLIEPLTGCH